jgi:hypothetical protein
MRPDSADAGFPRAPAFDRTVVRCPKSLTIPRSTRLANWNPRCEPPLPLVQADHQATAREPSASAAQYEFPAPPAEGSVYGDAGVALTPPSGDMPDSPSPLRAEPPQAFAGTYSQPAAAVQEAPPARLAPRLARPVRLRRGVRIHRLSVLSAPSPSRRVFKPRRPRLLRLPTPRRGPDPSIRRASKATVLPAPNPWRAVRRPR